MPSPQNRGPTHHKDHRAGRASPVVFAREVARYFLPQELPDRLSRCAGDGSVDVDGLAETAHLASNKRRRFTQQGAEEADMIR